MKIECQKRDLIHAVLSVQKAVAVKSVNPSLEGMLLKTDSDKIEIYGYNLELGIKATIDANVEQEGSIILNARIFGDIVRNLPDHDVSLSSDENFMTVIESGFSKFSIIGISPEEYPSLPLVKEASQISIPQNILKSMIKQTIFAVSLSESKPIYTGSMFELSENTIKIISIDGCRMAVREENIKLDKDKEKKFVVPGKTLNELLKLIGDNDEDVRISVDRKFVTFELANYYVISRLLEGSFMDYNTAVPKEYNTHVVVSVNNFIESIGRVSLLISDKVKFPIRCVFDNDNIKVSCMTTMGKARDETSAEIDGERVEIGFNEKYMTDALKNCDTDEVLIEIKNAFSPIKIVPKEGNSFLFLVLPVKLRD